MAKRLTMRGLPVAVLALAPLVVGACSPALDWRQVAPPASGATLLFPCRPKADERAVRIADVAASMRMHACQADGRWFTLSVVEAPSANEVGPMLAAMRRSAADNIGGQVAVDGSPPIAGATPNPQSARLRIAGKLPDGRPVVESALFFARGVRLYQASVIGEAELPADALDTFFASIRLA